MSDNPCATQTIYKTIVVTAPDGIPVDYPQPSILVWFVTPDDPNTYTVDTFCQDPERRIFSLEYRGCVSQSANAFSLTVKGDDKQAVALDHDVEELRILNNPRVTQWFDKMEQNGKRGKIFAASIARGSRGGYNCQCVSETAEKEWEPPETVTCPYVPNKPRIRQS